MISIYQRLFAITNSSVTRTKIHSMAGRRTKKTYRDRAKQQKTQSSLKEVFVALATGQTHNKVHETTFRFLYFIEFFKIKKFKKMTVIYILLIRKSGKTSSSRFQITIIDRKFRLGTF